VIPKEVKHLIADCYQKTIFFYLRVKLLLSVPVLIAHAVTLDFKYIPVCVGNPTVFDDWSEIQGDATAIISWSWDFGDGSVPVAVQNPTHTYPASGTYSADINDYR
jgi:hypothetical protein